MPNSSKKTGRVQLKREARKTAIMRIFRESDTPLSVTTVAQKTDFNFPVATSIISELVKEQLLEKIDKTVSTGGRPSNLFKLKANSVYAIGVSIERKYVLFLAVDITGGIIEEQTIHQQDITPTDTGWRKLLDCTNNFVEQSNLPRDKIIGAGFGFGSGAERTLIKDLQEGKKLIEQAQKTLGFPVRIENSGKLMIIAEKRLGLAKMKRNAICVFLGWSIGMGIIIQDKIYSGNHHDAGEFGHIVIDENGPLCYCGKRGCLETYVSGRSMVRDCLEQLKAGTQSMLMESCDGDLEKIDEEIIIQAALDGDLFSIELIESIGKLLGREISNLIKLFDPEVVILSGTIAEAGRFIVIPVQTMIDKLDLYYRTVHVKVVQSPLGHRAAALGAASMVLDVIFGIQHIELSWLI